MLKVIYTCRDESFNKQPSTANIKVTTSSGQTALDGTFLVQLTSCNITYITVDKSFNVLLIHVHNGEKSAARTIKTVSHEYSYNKLIITFYIPAGICQWD